MFYARRDEPQEQNLNTPKPPALNESAAGFPKDHLESKTDSDSPIYTSMLAHTNSTFH